MATGTYYQPGALYAEGTTYVDSRDRPVLKIGRAGGSFRQELRDLQEWMTAYLEGGDEALVALEARRQRQRLGKTGLAHCFKPSDVCPGGKRLENCETGSAAYDAAQEWSDTHNEDRQNGRVTSNVLARAGGCAACTLSCQVAVKTVNGEPDETRVSFYNRDPSLWTMTISPVESKNKDVE